MARETEASWLGVDVGGTKIQAVLCDERLGVIDSWRADSSAHLGVHHLLSTILEVTRSAVANRDTRPRAVGIGAAGVIDPSSGVVLTASDSFPQWAGIPLATVASEALGLPVTVDNDVNAFLRGEAAAGAARGLRHALGITVGTGIGGAVISDGTLLHGAHGGAGEIGHTPGFGAEPCTCGARGHLESVASGLSIARRYAERTGNTVDAAEVARRARAGDPLAAAMFTEAGVALGQAIATVATVLDSQIAVLGGGVIGAWDLLEPACRKIVRDSVLDTNADLLIAPATLGSLATAIGAASLARAAFGDSTTTALSTYS